MKALSCQIFNSVNGTGIAMLSSTYRLFVVNNVDDPRIRRMAEVPGKLAGCLCLLTSQLLFITLTCVKCVLVTLILCQRTIVSHPFQAWRCHQAAGLSLTRGDSHEPWLLRKMSCTCWTMVDSGKNRLPLTLDGCFKSETPNSVQSVSLGCMTYSLCICWPPFHYFH